MTSGKGLLLVNIMVYEVAFCQWEKRAAEHGQLPDLKFLLLTLSPGFTVAHHFSSQFHTLHGKIFTCVNVNISFDRSLVQQVVFFSHLILV